MHFSAWRSRLAFFTHTHTQSTGKSANTLNVSHKQGCLDFPFPSYRHLCVSEPSHDRRDASPQNPEAGPLALPVSNPPPRLAKTPHSAAASFLTATKHFLTPAGAMASERGVRRAQERIYIFFWNESRNPTLSNIAKRKQAAKAAQRGRRPVGQPAEEAVGRDAAEKVPASISQSQDVHRP